MAARITIFIALVLGSPAVLHAGQNVVVVVDDSGSMNDRMRSGGRRIQAAKRALQVVLEKLPEDAKIGVLALNQGWIIPLGKLDRSKTSGQINQLRANGGTLLGARLKLAADELLKLRKDQVYGDYRLLVVTDGEANDQPLLDYVLPDIMNRGLVVDVIGVDMVSVHSLAQNVHNYRRADDQASLETAIAESLAESDNEVAIGEESDFELIAGLPQEMALSVIGALTSAQNQPVGGSELNSNDFGTSGSMGLPVRRRSSNNSGGGGSSGFGFGAIFCMGIVFFAVATISSMLKAARRY